MDDHNQNKLSSFSPPYYAQPQQSDVTKPQPSKFNLDAVSFQPKQFISQQTINPSHLENTFSNPPQKVTPVIQLKQPTFQQFIPKSTHTFNVNSADFVPSISQTYRTSEYYDTTQTTPSFQTFPSLHSREYPNTPQKIEHTSQTLYSHTQSANLSQTQSFRFKVEAPEFQPRQFIPQEILKVSNIESTVLIPSKKIPPIVKPSQPATHSSENPPNKKINKKYKVYLFILFIHLLFFYNDVKKSFGLDFHFHFFLFFHFVGERTKAKFSATQSKARKTKGTKRKQNYQKRIC